MNTKQTHANQHTAGFRTGRLHRFLSSIHLLFQSSILPTFQSSILLLFTLAAFAPRAEAARQQMKITFGGYTNRSEVLTNFPVLVVLSNGVGNGFTFADFATTNGYDLRFATNSTEAVSSLNYEIESWNTNAGQASYVWVQVPTIPTNGQGAIWANWGNRVASNQLACTINGTTWDANYKGVWHFTEASGTRYDWTANRNTAAPNGTVNKETSLAYQADRFNYNDGDDYDGVANSASVTNLQTGDYTVESWFRPNSIPPGSEPAWNAFYGVVVRSGHNIGTFYDNAGKFNAGHYLTGDIWKNVVANSSSATGVLHHVVLAVSKSEGWVRLYVDGQEANSPATFTPGTAARSFTTPWRFGIADTGRGNYAWPADGAVDEVRLSGSTRSSNWIYACYLNQASNTVFNNYGAMTPWVQTPRQLKITFTGYTNRTEVLTNFPVLVVLSNNVGGSSSSYSDFLSPNGYDLRFGTDSKPPTTGLNYEIESWNPNGASYVWVQVPTLPTNGSGAIWANWGNTSASNQLPCTTNGAVWTNGYVGVWHMTDANATTVADSTTNRYSGTKLGTTPPVETTAVVGKGQNFTGAGYVDLPSGCTLKGLGVGNAFTIQFWFRCANTSDGLMDLMEDGTGFDRDSIYLFAAPNANLMAARLNTTTSPGVNKDDIGVGTLGTTWHCVWYVYDGSTVRLHVDTDSKWSSSISGPVSNGNTRLQFGCRPNGANSFLNGTLDEIQIANVFRSTNWLWASYVNQASNTVFNNYGAMEKQPVPKGTVIMVR